MKFIAQNDKKLNFSFFIFYLHFSKFLKISFFKITVLGNIFSTIPSLLNLKHYLRNGKQKMNWCTFKANGL